MAKFKVEMKKTLTRDDASRLLMDIAKAMANGRNFELTRDGSKIELEIPDEVKLELEIEENENEVELEFEIKWPRPVPASEPQMKPSKQSGKQLA